jgi:hypothetical protein
MKKSLLSDALMTAHRTLKNHPNTGSFLHWAFIIQDDSIVGYAMNDFGEPPSYFGYRCKRDTHLPSTRHAEFRALTKLKGIIDFRKSWEIINIRLNQLGEIRFSKPCNRCYELMKKFGCRKFYFTTDVGWAKMV